MKLDLTTIELHNFKSFTTRTFVILDECGVGLHFLRGRNNLEPRLGSNGAGKSTLWDALCWCLFGKTPDGLKNPDVLPWEEVEGPTTVQVTLMVDDNQRIIERWTRPNKLMIDGEGVGQEQVEQLVGMNYDTFCATILQGQSQPLFFDLKPAAKMELFSTVLQLDRWDAYADKASKQVKKLDVELRQIDSELRSIEDQEAQLEALEKRTKELSKEWSAEQIKRLDMMAEDLDKLENDLGTAQERLRKAELDSERAALSQRECQKAVVEARDSALFFDGEVRRAMSLERAKGRCPTCGQPWNKHKQSKNAMTLEEARVVADEADTKLGVCKDALASAEKAVTEADARVRLYLPQVAELEAKIRAIKDAREERQEEANPHRDQLVEIKKRLHKLDEEAEKLVKEEKAIGRERKRTEFWAKGFKEIRLRVIEDTLQELELATNAMLDEVGLVDWQVRFDIEKETKSGSVKEGLFVSILSPSNDKPVRWESWSGGETQRLRVIGALALSDVLLNQAGIEAGFEILDEPTSHMSPEGVRDLCDFLADRAASQGKQIWLVDQTAIESTRFASVMTILRDQNGSQVQNNGLWEASEARPKGTLAEKRPTEPRAKRVNRRA